MSHVPWGFCPPTGMGEIEVGENKKKKKVPGDSEIEEAKEGPCRESTICWAWSLLETFF